MNMRKMKPIHPGEILQYEFLEPMEMSRNKLAKSLHVPVKKVNEIVLSKRNITADMALRLAKFFTMSPQFWLGLQMDYDLDMAEDVFETKLYKKIVPFNVLG
ncbi:antitoxin HigA-1 [Candidatus Magnetomoraceae bacterium gMMP-1]